MATLERKLSVEAFFNAYESVPGKHELIRGVPVCMSGGNRLHYLVAHNVQRALDRQTVCGPSQSMMNAAVAAEDSVLNPDIALFCDPRDFTDWETERRFYFPRFVVEVLSPSTRRFDLNEKLTLYRALPSLDAILLIDPVSETFFWHRRTDTGWIADFLAPPEELDTDGLGFTLTRADIFAR